MIYAYLAASAALVLIADNFFPILGQPYSWWLCIALLLGLTLLFIIIQLICLVLFILCVNKKSDPERHSNFFRALIKASLPIVFKVLRIKLNISGYEKIEGIERAMVVCNHVNNIDPVMLLYAFPDLRLAFVSKKEAYDLFPFIAKAMHKLNCLPIDRENNREGAKTVVKAAKLLKQKTVSMGVFPEGYTSKTGELLPLRNGCFKIATRGEAPIIICTMQGMLGIHKRLFKQKNNVYLDVAAVLPFDEIKDLSTEEIGKIVYNTMKESIDKTKENINI